jgi:hypothetical protein
LLIVADLWLTDWLFPLSQQFEAAVEILTELAAEAVDESVKIPWYINAMTWKRYSVSPFVMHGLVHEVKWSLHCICIDFHSCHTSRFSTRSYDGKTGLDCNVLFQKQVRFIRR